MANLIAKKMSRLPIGTQVELTWGDGTGHYKQVSGTIVDSDFSASIELMTSSGEDTILSYAIIQGVSIVKSLEQQLRVLPEQTRIRFSYGAEEKREPDCSGTVLDNDHEGYLEIRTDAGEELTLAYSLIRSLVCPSGQAQPRPEAQQLTAAASNPVMSSVQEPEDALNASDHVLRQTFDALPKEDRKKLGGTFDSFQYGIKTNDSEKMARAAKQARQSLLQGYQEGYAWSREAAWLCGCLLRRTGQTDPEVFRPGMYFYGQALSFWYQEDYIHSGACAAMGLLAQEPEQPEELALLLFASVTKARDLSALPVLDQQLSGDRRALLDQLLQTVCRNQGVHPGQGQTVADILVLLMPQYPGQEMRAVLCALGGEPEKPEDDAAGRSPESEQAWIHGVISRLRWSERTGVITGDDGNDYTFCYNDITDPVLSKKIESCMRADLGGKVYLVKFRAKQTDALMVEADASPVDRARAIVADNNREDRFEAAFSLCKMALDSTDARRALVDLIKYTLAIYSAGQQTDILEQAIALYEKHSLNYPDNAFAIMDVVRCYFYLKRYPQMVEHGEKAVAIPGLMVRQRIMLLSQYLKMLSEYFQVSGDRALLKRVLALTDGLKENYARELVSERQVRELYCRSILHFRIIAECGLDMLSEAEADLARLPEACLSRPEVEVLVEETRQRLKPEEPEKPEAPVSQPESLPDSQPKPELPRETGFPGEDKAQEEGEEEEEIPPYQDSDGWAALRCSKDELARYALSIDGPDRIPAMLAYLRAGAALNGALLPLYRVAALAVNDPMEAPDYSAGMLIGALSDGDPDYPVFNDYCMGAAFLRAAFQTGMAYDYSTRGLRDSIAVCQHISALSNTFDLLEEFHRQAGKPIDIYADYRNFGVKTLLEELDTTVRIAGELYTKFILTPAREDAKLARLLETKKIVFARDGYLATMLQYVMERDQDALEREKSNFAGRYLNDSPQISEAHISDRAIDQLIVESWDQAGSKMRLHRNNSTLQGDRRNNLRSNISMILRTICRWYVLSEQSAGITWRTPQGEAAYQRLRPRLLEQLQAIQNDCGDEQQSCAEVQCAAGLFLLAATARELEARLDGSWHFGQERYLYVDFLRSDRIMLREDFMPELSSTFCALPEFNVLARIRQHVEGPKWSFQQQIDRIYSPERSCNNYGTAEQIIKYLSALGLEPVTLPDQAERFVSQTERQVDIRYRGFQETYALAMNYGQIIKTDAFCYTLEDTAQYWYAFCRKSKNYGFFTSLLLRAEEQIHHCARQYEEQLEEQLEALIANNRRCFEEHPDYEEAIRSQIAGQNFTVAEDWMARIRIGDFSLNLQQPEALNDLESFWNSYADIFRRVADGKHTLSSLLSPIDGRNRDRKRAQQLIDNWLLNGRPSNPARIGQLLNLLGWQDLAVSVAPFAGELHTELYEARREHRTVGPVAPQHPVAAFGSALDKKPMYVACLYGAYDCDRLIERIRALEGVNGSVLVLVDWALGQADRRALARKLKRRESGLRNVYLVIDRVLITFLASQYNDNLINRILMAVAMPFSYYQPYVVESIHTMPPEIFIGRKDELLKIEQPDGVNLIYGGRQLGKSALFKKALSDLDGCRGQRAVLIDIGNLDCAGAARKVSGKLIDQGITPGEQVTEDWQELCRRLERRLRGGEPEEISYFLLMLDEADRFIDDCSSCGYQPLVALKDVQQSLPGQFKYVLAGLHNVVKFNRQVALGNNSVITHMSSLKITPFHTPEAQELLTLPLSYLGFSLPSKVTVSQILATCNYFPGLIQLYAKKLLESVRAADYAGYDESKTPPYVVSDEHLRRVMSDREFVDQIHEKFEITLTLDQDQGSLYYPVTLLIGWMYNDAPSKSGYTARDVLRCARELSIGLVSALDEEKISALLLELQDLNILRSVSNDSFLLASKNFRDLLGSDEEIMNKLIKVVGDAL